MSGVTVTVEGVDAALKRLKRMPESVIKAVSQTLYLEAEGIMTQSKQLVPVKTGNLRASGHVGPLNGKWSPGSWMGSSGTMSTNPKATIQLGYGGPAASYAVKVHEDLEMFHPGGGIAKYLELPVKQAMGGMSQRIVAAATQALKSS